MADIRIKDLTTTASSTASDDFIAVDGTTNGTRKLNAFSPTFGGNVVVTGTLTSNSTLSTAAGLIAQNADFNAGYIILRGYGSQDGGLVFFGQSANNNFINSNATTISTSIAGNAVSNNVAAGFRVLTTTASTSTSSGALVVSGGVGVAGAIYAGGDLTVDKTEPTITFKRAANTNLNIVNFWTGVNADFGIGLRNTSDSDLHIYNYGTSNDALKIAKADSLATFGGAVRTAAPSGGTAANWKLGTVASVSPTSPNRTIEVDIGGTIYYIHAKTTNN